MSVITTKTKDVDRDRLYHQQGDDEHSFAADALRVRLERDHGDRANQSDHVGREPGSQSICRVSLWPK